MCIRDRGYITDVGADNRFRPTEPITRAELINLLNNMVDTLIQQSGDYSTSVPFVLVE